MEKRVRGVVLRIPDGRHGILDKPGELEALARDGVLRVSNPGQRIRREVRSDGKPPTVTCETLGAYNARLDLPEALLVGLRALVAIDQLLMDLGGQESVARGRLGELSNELHAALGDPKGYARIWKQIELGRAELDRLVRLLAVRAKERDAMASKLLDDGLDWLVSELVTRQTELSVGIGDAADVAALRAAIQAWSAAASIVFPSAPTGLATAVTDVFGLQPNSPTRQKLWAGAGC
jgi:hypothetical protein